MSNEVQFVTPLNVGAPDTDTVRIMYFEPSVAHFILENFPYTGQRATRPQHVEELAKIMREGKFLPTKNILLGYKPDGSTHCLDGLHTLNAVVKTGLIVKLTLWQYLLETDEEMAEVYTGTDVGLTRDKGAQIYALLQNEPDLRHYNQQQATKLLSGVFFIKENFGTSKFSAKVWVREQIPWLREYKGSADKYISALRNRPGDLKQSMTRFSTVAVALETYQYSAGFYGQTMVDNFWNGVIFDDGLRIGDPRKTARKFLLTYGTAGSETNNDSMTRSNTYMSRYLANCFNAYTEGRTLEKTAVGDDKAPIRINGTSFTGKK